MNQRCHLSKSFFPHFSSYLNSQQQYLAAAAAQQQGGGLPYGVPIPPPLVPGLEDEDPSPLPPPRSSSSNPSKSRGKRSRHSGTSSSYHHENPTTTSRSSHKDNIHYPKYDVYTDYPSSKYTSSSRDHCQYTNKYGEDCHYNKYSQKDSCSYKTWPKQQYVDEAGQAYSQDDQNIHYLHELEENARLIQQQQQEHAGAKYAQVSKKHKQREYYEDRGTSR